MNLTRMLKYLSMAFSLGFLWESFRTQKATDPATQTSEYAGVAALVMADDRAAAVFAQATPEEQQVAIAAGPLWMRMLDALSE
jgi:hypothetical protein